MTRIILTLVSSLLVSALAFGQTYYLKFDESCMERMEYASENETAAYVSYNFPLGQGKIVHFDIGKEEVKWVQDLPGKVIYCNDLKVDANLVNTINSGTVKVYIVRESPTHYNVSAVDKAVYIENYGPGVRVTMEDADFVLELTNLISNRNLAMANSQMAVFLEGTIQYRCTKGYILKKMQDFSSTSFKEYILIPEVGIVEKRLVSKMPTQTAAKISNLLKLNVINNRTLTEVITAYCDAIQANYYDSPNSVGGTTSSDNMVPKGGKEQGVPTSYDSSPCSVAPREGVHMVQKGETLYSISKRYGITLDQIRSWNGMGSSSAINVCQALNVKQQNSTSQGTTAPGGASATSAQDGFWEKGAAVHIVRPGESVEALAKMFGYTEDRFRKMNSLGQYERVYAGQRLHTSDCACPTLQSTTAGTPLPYESPTETLTAKGNPDVYFKPIKVHLVKASESLFSISKQYGTTVDRIVELNGLQKNAQLATGQRLYVQ